MLIVHTCAKKLHSTQTTKSLQIGSHMFLNVRDELGPVPSNLGEVVGVVSQHDATFSRRSLVQCLHSCLVCFTEHCVK